MINRESIELPTPVLKTNQSVILANEEKKVQQSITTDLPFVSNSSIDFYPWNDGINYNKFCLSLARQLSQFQGPMIFHYGFQGGLGHKTISVISSILHALYAKRPLKCI